MIKFGCVGTEYVAQRTEKYEKAIEEAINGKGGSEGTGWRPVSGLSGAKSPGRRFDETR